MESQATATVGRAIQKMGAARLGRAFMPLGMLVVLSVGTLITGGGKVVTPVGALISAGTMLAYALAVVQKAFARPRRPWMTVATMTAVIPPGYALWVLGWLGFRGTAEAAGVLQLVAAILYAILGGWALWGWIRLLELNRLAETMTLELDGMGRGHP